MTLPSSSIFIIKQKKHTIMKHFWLSLLPLFWCIFINKQNTIENMSVIFFSPPAKGKKNIIPIMSLSTDYFRLPFFKEC